MRAALAMLLLAGCSPDAARPARAARPVRICSVTIATDEMLAELVDPARVVAVSTMADEPGISNVAGFYGKDKARVKADLETILQTNPDLVLVASFSSPTFLEVLDRAGLNVFRYDTNDTFAAVEKSIGDLGAVVGESDRAAAMVATMRRRLDDVAAKLKTAGPKPRVFYWSRGWTAAKDTNVGDMIEHAGGINVAAEMGLTGHPQLALERAIASDPDVLLIPDWSGVEKDAPESTFPDAMRQLRAVKEGRVHRIEGRLISTISQHVVDGVEWLAQRLHPECFEAGK